MFGTFRYALALLVVAKHLWTWNWLGIYAVFGFYLLSGYLMTRVLTATYPATVSGTGRFLTNRALRIYPPYFAVALFGLGVVLWQPELAERLSPALQVPETPWQWLQNFWIFGQNPLHPPRLVPPAWSLHVELVFYVLMGLGLGRLPIISVVWLVASLGYTGWLLADGAGLGERYYPVAAASLPFALGSFLAHYRSMLARRLPRWGAIAAAGLFAANAARPDLIWDDVYVGGFYASLLLCGWAVASLAPLRPATLPGWARRIDRILGDLSYPIFLCHWAVGVCVAALFFDGAIVRGQTLFVASIVGVHGIALAVHFGVERPVERWRDRVRAG